MTHTCPLCSGSQIEFFHQDRAKKRQRNIQTNILREYYRCSICSLVFVPPHQYLSPIEEKTEYDLHQNSPTDQGYRRFLSRLFKPIQNRLAPQSQGLDFGSGPGPTLSVMFEEMGHKVALYDRFYADDSSLFEQTYDFITATEVVEHLHNPGQELERLWDCLKPGGWLGIMTKLVIDQAAFANWHYKNDRTHVSFFSQATFQWLAEKWLATLEFQGTDVMIFTRGQDVSHSSLSTATSSAISSLDVERK